MPPRARKIVGYLHQRTAANTVLNPDPEADLTEILFDPSGQPLTTRHAVRAFDQLYETTNASHLDAAGRLSHQTHKLRVGNNIGQITPIAAYRYTDRGQLH